MKTKLSPWLVSAAVIGMVNSQFPTVDAAPQGAIKNVDIKQVPTQDIVATANSLFVKKRANGAEKGLIIPGPGHKITSKVVGHDAVTTLEGISIYGPPRKLIIFDLSVFFVKQAAKISFEVRFVQRLNGKETFYVAKGKGGSTSWKISGIPCVFCLINTESEQGIWSVQSFVVHADSDAAEVVSTSPAFASSVDQWEAENASLKRLKIEGLNGNIDVR